uniref:Cystatin domain-containing protein n=1 Tax=Strongyloides venezuelensis TaxID=75913 RepID=A0A0K0FQ50_STRVS
MKYFFLVHILFSAIFIVILSQTIQYGKWKNLNPNSPVVRKWAKEGVSLYGAEKNKTFILVQVIRAQTRNEFSSPNITIKRRKVVCTAKNAMCLKPRRCIRTLRTIIVNYLNGTRTVNVMLI